MGPRAGALHGWVVGHWLSFFSVDEQKNTQQQRSRLDEARRKLSGDAGTMDGPKFVTTTRGAGVGHVIIGHKLDETRGHIIEL